MDCTGFTVKLKQTEHGLHEYYGINRHSPSGLQQLNGLFVHPRILVHDRIRVQLIGYRS